MAYAPQDPRAPVLDMTPDGRFLPPPRPPMTLKVGGLAAVVALVALGLGVAALALWFALILIPVALGAAAVAWVAFRLRAWRARGGLFGRHPGGVSRF